VTRFSINRAWDESRSVLRRDRGPIATVASALLVLPGTLLELVAPEANTLTVTKFDWWFLSGLAVLVLSIVGQLTISRIALGSRQSVGEAMSLAARRTPVFLLAMAAWLLPFLLLAAPFALRIQANPNVPSGGALLGLFLIALLFVWIGVRFLFATPVAAAEPVGPIGILRQSWVRTAGHWWKLFGFFLLFMILAIVLEVATNAVGVVVKLVDASPERMSVGALVIALANQIAAAALGVGLTVFLTRLYRQAVDAAGEPASVPHAP
jgi:hypothetical protein